MRPCDNIVTRATSKLPRYSGRVGRRFLRCLATSYILGCRGALYDHVFCDLLHSLAAAGWHFLGTQQVMNRYFYHYLLCFYILLATLLLLIDNRRSLSPHKKVAKKTHKKEKFDYSFILARQREGDPLSEFPCTGLHGAQGICIFHLLFGGLT